MRPVKWKCTISISVDICVRRLARWWELEGNDAAAGSEHEHPLSMSHLLTAPHPLIIFHLQLQEKIRKEPRFPFPR